MYRFSRFIFRKLGWKIVGNQPTQKKYIIAVVPHTSTTDFFMGMLISRIMRVKTFFLIKKDFFFFPLNLLLKLCRAIPVNRKAPKSMISRVVKEINSREDFVLVVTPEGTRKKVKKWKKGFYYLAQKADIPIMPAALDYKNKIAYFGEVIHPIGDGEDNFHQLIKFYKEVNPTARHPEKFAYPE